MTRRTPLLMLLLTPFLGLGCTPEPAARFQQAMTGEVAPFRPEAGPLARPDLGGVLAPPSSLVTATRRPGFYFEGEIECWGDGHLGQVREAPVAPVAAFSISFGTGCAVQQDSTLTCWGRDDAWGLVSEMPTGPGWSDVEVGVRVACASRVAGGVHCWGASVPDVPMAGSPPETGQWVDLEPSIFGAWALNPDGEVLGWGHDYPPGIYDQVPTAPKFQKIEGGYTGACGLTDDGFIECWGEGGPAWSSLNPWPLDGGFEDLAVGSHTACALRGGAIECWGSSGWNLLDDVPAGSNWTRIAAGPTDFCALDDAGGVHCWGADFSWIRDSPSEQGFVDIEVGSWSACAQRADGSLRCWGRGSESFAPRPTASGIAIDAGDMGVCALDEAGAIHCMGDIELESPPLGGGFQSIDVDYWMGCAIDASNAGQCWGYWPPDPVQMAALGSDLVLLVSGHEDVCGLSSDGTMRCTGSDGLPGVWQDVALTREGICAVDMDGFITCTGLAGAPARGGYISLDAASERACAVHGDGSVDCWGQPYGAIEPGVTGAAPTDARYVDIQVGDAVTCTLDEQGGLGCWGRNQAGGASEAPTNPGWSGLAMGARTCAIR